MIKRKTCSNERKMFKKNKKMGRIMKRLSNKKRLFLHCFINHVFIHPEHSNGFFFYIV
jgi:hypothetical protein